MSLANLVQYFGANTQAASFQNLAAATFPDQDHWHAGCDTTTVVQDSCEIAWMEITRTVKGFKSGGPAKGLYDVVS